MKNKRGSRQPAAIAVQQETYNMPDSTVGRTIDMTDHPLYRQSKKNFIMESCEDCRMQIETENRRLEILVEDLKLDKLCQAERLKELNEETSRLKNAFAELMVDNHNLKQAIK